MAHEINFNAKRGTHSFASFSETAWHGLGQIVENAMTSKEAIELANLDYTVEKSPIYFGENKSEIDAYFTTYRTDTNESLGVVKSRYELVQNVDAFDFFDAIIDSGEAIYQTAGALGKGERIFLTAKLPEDFLVGGEKINQYLLLTNSHDGSSSILVGFTNIRVVCNNTLQAAMRSLNNKVSITHIKGAKDKLREASKVMKIQSEYTMEVSEIFNRMIDVKMNHDDFDKFFTKIFTPPYKAKLSAEQQAKQSTRFKNMINGTLNFCNTHPTQTTQETQNTLWGAYNGVSGYYNYMKPYNDAEDKFTNQFFGTANRNMLKSFELALDLMK